MELLSAIGGVRWPALAFGRAAELMALQRQLDATQWLSPEELRALQFRQLRLLVAHAATVPFYAERLRACGIVPGQPIEAEAWARLPVLTRRDLQELGERLYAALPATHGGTSVATSGGSTGVPVRVRRSGLDQSLFEALLLRQELWHRDDPTGTIAVIRGVAGTDPPEVVAALDGPGQVAQADAGPPLSSICRTGPVFTFNAVRPIAEQVAWLQTLQPAYLMTRPSNLRLLLAHFREYGLSLPSLRAVWSRSEVIDEALREQCQRVWGCKIVHNYSAAETGLLALQCPENPHFHVQAETVLLEMLDEAGRACRDGMMGRVVVTPLHSFAMPLLRYELGDLAVPGPECACGRKLPVLARIAGRTMDALRLANGERRRVDTAHYILSRIEAVREFQLAQVAFDTVEVRLVAARALLPAEEAEVRADLAWQMGAEIRIVFAYRDALPRTASEKLRTFVSELDGGRV